MSRALYSAQLDLQGQAVVMLGAGKVALQKLKGLPHGLGSVRIFAREASPVVKRWVAGRSEAKLLLRPLKAGDLKGCRLLFCCASEAQANAQAALWGRRAGTWICQTEEPSQGNLQVPAVIRAGGLSLTLSTGGASPALAKALRQHWEQSLKVSDLAWVLAQLKRRRAALKADPRKKNELLAQLKTKQALALMLKARTAQTRRQLAALLK